MSFLCAASDVKNQCQIAHAPGILRNAMAVIGLFVYHSFANGQRDSEVLLGPNMIAPPELMMSEVQKDRADFRFV